MITNFRVGSTTVNFLLFRKFFSINKFRSVMSQGCLLGKECGRSGYHQYVGEIKKFIPQLTPDLHKGQRGRIGIIGGSAEYTGAPYFSAISSLKMGADIVYIFCCRDAGAPIKSYSPELIVLPVLDNEDFLKKIEPWLPRFHALVIGPGLGRNADIHRNVAEIINHCKKNLEFPPPLVIDADGLVLIAEDFKLIQDYKGPVILTPNAKEYERIGAKLPEPNPLTVAATLNAVIVQKGLKDIITNGIHNRKFNLDSKDVTLVCDVAGSNRRCGGQGDILAGCMAVFTAWYHLHRSSTSKDSSLDFTSPTLNVKEGDMLNLFKEKYLGYSLAAYGACMITRTCSRLAFQKYGRSMTTTDMIPCIHEAFELYFGV